jgi:hypothetical protein
MTTKGKITAALAHALLGVALGFCIGGITAAHARDYWNSSGYPLDHNFHSPYDHMFRGNTYNYYGGGYYRPSYRPAAPAPEADYDDDGVRNTRESVEVVDSTSAQFLRRQNELAVAKAIHDERVCAPVVIYGDTVTVHPALGCRR